MKKYLNKNDSIVYVGRPTCSDFEPELLKYLEEEKLNGPVVYLNVEDVRKNEPEWEKFKEIYHINYTPTLAKFENGEMISKTEWTPEKGISISQVNEWFSKMN